VSRDRNWSHNQPPPAQIHWKISEPPVEKPSNNVICPGWPGGCGGNPLNLYNHNNPKIPAGQISHGMCPECEKASKNELERFLQSRNPPTLKEIYHELAIINEDYTFEPTKDTQLPAMSARHMMTQLPGQKRKDLMKPYRFTKDKSSARSDRLRKRYRNKNRKNAKPFSRLPYGF
jgi:hypothetical protein